MLLLSAGMKVTTPAFRLQSRELRVCESKEASQSPKEPSRLGRSPEASQGVLSCPAQKVAQAGVASPPGAAARTWLRGLLQPEGGGGRDGVGVGQGRKVGRD